ncbi:unnamed protein product [Clonostachys rhizophaga]|uniref:Uncharacterized protein n=1 Tax=Clonostachys rhizophaga TaxID=160324 RepID=A0A9N9V4E4_9HYPO|nr:unnamed protein product [Clonostachys rhizophaga]
MAWVQHLESYFLSHLRRAAEDYEVTGGREEEAAVDLKEVNDVGEQDSSFRLNHPRQLYCGAPDEAQAPGRMPILMIGPCLAHTAVGSSKSRYQSRRTSVSFPTKRLTSPKSTPNTALTGMQALHSVGRQLCGSDLQELQKWRTKINKSKGKRKKEEKMTRKDKIQGDLGRTGLP